MKIIEAQWQQVKEFALARKVSIQFIDYNGNYYLSVSDGTIGVTTILSKEDPENPDVVDFETNFKANGNLTAAPVTQTLPFSAKTVGDKKLYKRVVGITSAVNEGANVATWTCTFPWVKFMACEIIGGEVGDTCSLYVLDTATGAFTLAATGTAVPNAPLNQFGFNANISKDYYQQRSEFDADLYAGLQIKIVYNSISAKTVGFNFVMNEVKST